MCPLSTPTPSFLHPSDSLPDQDIHALAAKRSAVVCDSERKPEAERGQRSRQTQRKAWSVRTAPDTQSRAKWKLAIDGNRVHVRYISHVKPLLGNKDNEKWVCN